MSANDLQLTGEERYRLVRPVESCFQAELHVAERSGVEGFVKQLTIWTVRPELCKQSAAVDLLLEDLKQAAGLSGWAICQVLDVWRRPPSIAFATEYVSGWTLAGGMDRATEHGERLPLPVVLSILLEVARALERAHSPHLQSGPVVHGDLRPDLVLIGREGTIRVSGFGFARFLPAVSRDARWCTWNGRCYQPPERLQGESLDPRVDVFSLGAMLLEATTGAPPYGVGDPEALQARLSAGAFSVIPDGVSLPPAISRVVTRACALRPEDRHATVEELSADLNGLLLAQGCVRPDTGLVRDVLQRLTPPVVEDRHTMEHTVEIVAASSALSKRRQRRRRSRASEVRLGVTPLVGREHALRQAGEALAGAMGGMGRVLLFVGQPGMGRTRILAEVAERVSNLQRKVTWLEARARPADRTTRFTAVLRLLSSAIGLGPERDLRALADKADRLHAFGLKEQELEAIRGLIGAASPPDPSRITGLLGQALFRCISSLSWEHPTLITLDDLQWTDEASLECLAEVLPRLQDVPVVVLMTATSDFAPPWPAAVATTLELLALSRDECGQIALGLSPDAQSIEGELLAELGRRADGNPLVLQELLLHLWDEDHIEVQGGELRFCPDRPVTLPSLEEVVRARIDALDDDTRQISLAAALAGPALHEAILIRATGVEESRASRALKALTDEHRLLLCTPTGFCFSHERMRRAVLDAADTDHLQALRGRLAKTILTQWDEPEVSLAQHAVDLLAAAGDRAAATKVCAEIASQLERRGDIRGATERYSRTLELAGTGDVLSPVAELNLCLRTGRSALHRLDLELADTALARAVTLAQEQQDAGHGAEARVLQCRIRARQGRLQESMALAKEALPMASESGDRLMTAQAYAAIAETMQQWGEYGPDLEYITSALRIAEEEGDLPLVAEYLQLCVMHSAGVGEFERTQEYLDRARAIARTADDPVLTCQLYKAEALIHTFQSLHEEALRINLAGLDRARQHGLAEAEIVFLHNAGDNHLHLGNLPEALHCLGESLRRSQEAHFDRLTEANEMFVGYLEAAHLGAPAGFDRLQDAIDSGRQSGRRWNLTQGHQLMGRALLEQGDRDGAIAHLEEAYSCAKEANVRFFMDEAYHWLEIALGTPRPAAPPPPPER